MKFTIVGSGYVGMSLAALISRKYPVTVHDIDSDRIEMILNKKSTVQDKDITNFFQNKNLILHATNNKNEAYSESDIIIVATPTNYCEVKNRFDTSSVDQVIKDALSINSKALIVIKSTIPVGYTKGKQEKYNTNKIIFSPEFLREGSALYDNLYPSRIVVGSNIEEAKQFALILKDLAEKENVDLLFMESTEAESVKLFANTYLAMRVAFFNELDSFAMANNLSTKSIIDGVSMDERIGNYYNNPSFGYGGYCLPKDTKELLSLFSEIPQSIIESIVTSNDLRKGFLSDEILKKYPKTVGCFRIIMKSNSDNYRSSAVLAVIDKLNNSDIDVIIYEPSINQSHFEGYEVINDLESFKSRSDIIICNRLSDELTDVASKIFTRDVYGNN